jgi:hypothetical protein
MKNQETRTAAGESLAVMGWLDIVFVFHVVVSRAERRAYHSEYRFANNIHKNFGRVMWPISHQSIGSFFENNADRRQTGRCGCVLRQTGEPSNA